MVRAIFVEAEFLPDLTLDGVFSKGFEKGFARITEVFASKNPIRNGTSITATILPA